MEASGILRSSKVAGKSPIKMEVESWEIHEKIRKWWAIPETWRFRGKIIKKKWVRIESTKDVMMLLTTQQFQQRWRYS